MDEAGIDAIICLQSELCHEALQIECVCSPPSSGCYHGWDSLPAGPADVSVATNRCTTLCRSIASLIRRHPC